MDNLLQNPANPFVVWVYVLTYGLIFAYLGYLLWRRRRG
jgi:hypothetical protein